MVDALSWMGKQASWKLWVLAAGGTTVYGWDSRSLEVIGCRNWRNKLVSSELLRAVQIRMARKRFALNGGQDLEYLLLQRV